MATTKKAKTTAETTKKAATKKTTKKSATIEQIEKLEKALEKTKEEDVINLVPEAIKEDIESEKSETEPLVDVEPVDLDTEVKKIFETAEPSKEVKEQFEEFQKGKEEFNKKMESDPANAEKLIKDELKRVEALKKKAEAIRAGLQKDSKINVKNDNFTNWWNGSSNLF